MTTIDVSIYNHLCIVLKSPTLLLNAVNGGSINQTVKVSTNKQNFFCKINSATKFPHLFENEAEGLQLIHSTNSFKTPKVIDIFETNSYQVLLLEWIESATPIHFFWKHFGQALASLHATTQEKFGLEKNNYMGSVAQVNTLSTDWPLFFIEQRLEPLVKQCHSLNLLTATLVAKFHDLYQRIPIIFNEEPPSLLHGDLWSGNFMCTTDQQPVVIDPAVYFGHRSVDLAMTTLFGGFDKTFYEAYHYYHPFPPNYKEQWAVSNLYPLLIHLLLFGTSYLASIERTLNDFQ